MHSKKRSVFGKHFIHESVTGLKPYVRLGRSEQRGERKRRGGGERRLDCRGVEAE